MKKTSVLIYTNSLDVSENLGVTFNFYCRKTDKLVRENIDQLYEEGSMDFYQNAVSFFIKDRKDVFVILKEGRQFVAAMVIGYSDKGWSSPDVKYKIQSVSVRETHQKQGLSVKLIEQAFLFFQEKNILKIEQTPYTDEGLQCLSHVFDRVSKRFEKISFNDSKKVLN